MWYNSLYNIDELTQKEWGHRNDNRHNVQKYGSAEAGI